MAGNIKGLTVEIGGNTTKLGKALESVEKKSRSLSGELGQINRLLKMDPGNADLLAQKQKVLAEAVANTGNKLKALKEASEHAAKTAGNYDAWKAKYDPLQEEIGQVTDKLKELKKQQADMEEVGDVGTDAYKQLQEEIAATGGKLKTLRKQVQDVNEEFDNPASPEQLRELQREVVATEKKLESYERAAQETAEAVEKLGNGSDDAADDLDETGDEAKKAGKELDDFGDAADRAEKSSGGLGKTLAGAVKTGLAAVGAVAAAAVTGLVAAAESTREYRTEMGKLTTAFTTAGHSSAVATEAYRTLYGVIGETDQSVEAAQQIALLAESEKDVAQWADLAAGVVGRFGDALQPETFFEAANETLKLNEATGAYVQLLEGVGMDVETFNKGLAACTTEQERQAYMLGITQQALAGAGDAYREANAEVIRANEANDAWMQSLAGVGGAIEPIITDIKLMGASLLAEAVPGVQALAEAFRGLMNGEDGAAADFGAAFSGLVTGLVEKVTAALPAVAEVGLSIIKTLATSLAQQLPTLLSTGGQIIGQLLSGIASNLPSLAQSALSAIGNLVNGFQSGLPQVLAKGREILLNLATGIKENLPSLVSQALDIVMNFATTIYDNAPTLIQTGFEVLSNLVSGIMSSLPVLISKVPEILSKFANTINHNMPMILKKGAELILQIVAGIISAIPTLVANIPKIIKAIVDVWSAFNWVQLGKNAITFLKNGIANMVGAVKGAGKNVLDSITNALASLPSKLLNLGKNALTSLKNAITSARGAVSSAGGNILTAVVNALKSMPSKLLSMGKNAISQLGSAIGAGVGAIRSKASSIVSSVVSTFSSLPGKMVSVGKNIISGVISGIGSMVGSLYSSIKNAMSGLVDKAKSALGIASPSKVFAKEVGAWIPAGVATGTEDNMKTAAAAMVGMADDAVDAANAELARRSLNAPGLGSGVNGLQLERGLYRQNVAAQTVTVAPTGLAEKLDRILAAIERGQVLTIDGKQFVGGTAAMYDNTLGQRRALAARGAL